MKCPFQRAAFDLSPFSGGFGQPFTPIGARAPLVSALPTQFASVLTEISRLRATSACLRLPSSTCDTAFVRNVSVYFLSFATFITCLHKVKFNHFVGYVSGGGPDQKAIGAGNARTVVRLIGAASTA